MRRVGVFLLAEKAQVELAPGAVQLGRLLSAIEGAGFSASLLDTTGGWVAGGCCHRVPSAAGCWRSAAGRGWNPVALQSQRAAAPFNSHAASPLDPTRHPTHPPAAETRAVKLSVGGMACASCSAAVEAALAAVPGVVGATVSLTLGQADVHYGEGACTPADLVAAVEGAGFEASGGWVGGWVPVGGACTGACAELPCTASCRLPLLL